MEGTRPRRTRTSETAARGLECGAGRLEGGGVIAEAPAVDVQLLSGV